jgi:octaprenyl-diphosphate synthase
MSDPQMQQDKEAKVARELGFLSAIQDKLKSVEEKISDALASDIPYVRETGTYVSQSGGKRMRPILLLLCSRLCGYGGTRDTDYACVVECIHAATLIHDDIIDQARIRRGKESINSIFGDHVTVLIGDYLYLKAMKRALDLGNLEILHLLSDATLEMIGGELIQLSKSGDADMKEEEYFEIIRRKTAMMFYACGRIAAILGEVSEEKKEAVGAYALNVGIAFQLVDDVLDFAGNEEVLGKPVNNDLREGKLTLPLIHLIQNGRPEDANKIRWILKKRDLSGMKQEDILEILNQYGCLDYTLARAVEFARKANEHLGAFDDSDLKSHLVRLPEFILSRKF